MPTSCPESYEEFVSHLEDREFFGQKLGLERIQSVLDQLGHPEGQFPSIHIAGTNGKGSTAAMVASILKEAGYKVGLYTSPHLVDFCERIRVFSSDRSDLSDWFDRSLIPQNQVLHWARVVQEVEGPADPLTFFELSTALGFLHFADQKVDIAVVEVGMGGRLDATNVITPLVSVITSIGLDHTQHLGDTLSKVAFEKAGIIKRGVPVVVGDLPEEAMAVVREIAEKKGTGVKRGQQGVRAVNLPGDHQQRNARVAVTVIEELYRQGWSIPDRATEAGLANVFWPGRLETVQEEPWILLDGAHNPQAMAAVRRFLEARREGRCLKVLFGSMADKDIRGMLVEIAPIADELILTAPRLRRAAPPQLLADVACQFGKRVRVIEGVDQAFREVRGDLRCGEVLLITGSLFVVGEVSRG